MEIPLQPRSLTNRQLRKVTRATDHTACQKYVDKLKAERKARITQARKLLLEGKSREEVAEIIGVAIATIKSYMKAEGTL